MIIGICGFKSSGKDTIADYLIRDYDLQQMVLEYNDINEKISFLYRLIESNELTN
jgi:ATP-dependent Lon protease